MSTVTPYMPRYMNNERPIIFNTQMVRAILDGMKTQTRRIVKPQPYCEESIGGVYGPVVRGHVVTPQEWAVWFPCKLCKPGDRLWVRETFSSHIGNFGESIEYAYRATHDDRYGPWKPSIHMPREASRILLEVTDIRVERLKGISEEDAIAEGISRVPFRPDDGWPICDGYMVGKDDGVTSLDTSATKAYKKLWESLYGQGSWDLNPWVWVVEFKVISVG